MVFYLDLQLEIRLRAVRAREVVKGVAHAAPYAEEEGKVAFFAEQQGESVRVFLEHGDDFFQGEAFFVGRAETHALQKRFLFLLQYVVHVGEVFVKRAPVVARDPCDRAYGYLFDGLFAVQFPECGDKCLSGVLARNVFLHFPLLENPTNGSGLSCQIC